MTNTKNYSIKNFNLGELKGISSKNIEEHLKLYSGYVNNTNLIFNKIKEYSEDLEKNSYAISELHRRLGFEFGGMRNHEYYFGALEGGPQKINEESNFFKAITESCEGFEKWLEKFKNIALTRGVGWAMLYYDKQSGYLINHWIDEQHIGHPVGLSPILCLDMWEHAFVYDYATSEKKKYVEAYFENINWSVIENNFEKAK